MKNTKAHTPEQVAGAEKIINILMTVPDDIRDIAAIAASAYIDGLIAGQVIRESADSDEGRKVLANQ